MRCAAAALFLLALLNSTAPALADEKAPHFPSLWPDLVRLADDSMEGRESGTPGAALARDYLSARYAELALQPVANQIDYQHKFEWRTWGQSHTGINLLGIRRGCRDPDHYLVISAHYDHVGRVGAAIYNGADDNASGVAGMLALANANKQTCPNYSLLFLATDAEEKGLQGAKAFLQQGPLGRDALLFNLNLDMIGRGERQRRLHVLGSPRLPMLQDTLKSYRETFAAELRLEFISSRHHSASPIGNRTVNWLQAGDHAVFYRAGVPFVYLGVDLHTDYHLPTDDSARISPQFLSQAVEVAEQVLLHVDQQPLAILRALNRKD